MQFKTALLTTVSLVLLNTTHVHAQDQFTNTLNFESSSLPYNWHTTAWTTCEGVCFIGQQARSVDCKDNAGASAPSEADCNHTPKPEERRQCELPPCAWVEPPCRSGSPHQSGVPSFDGSTAAPLDSEYFRYNTSNDTVEGFIEGAKFYEHDLSPPEPEASSSSGGGGSVLCGHFFTRGILPKNIYNGDLVFAQTHVNDSIKRGYRLWAVPLTRYLNSHPNGLAEKIVQPFVVGWATEMAYRTRYHHKGSIIGNTLLNVAAPIVNFLGLFVKDTEFNSLKSERLIAQMSI